mmetsp:Transcript_8467/g.23523  ORF Transcript_8467/g.23523 Transcript_8467/m.23523 type:complete len:174 (-) Transcript_8467:92-613(-)
MPLPLAASASKIVDGKKIVLVAGIAEGSNFSAVGAEVIGGIGSASAALSVACAGKLQMLPDGLVVSGRASTEAVASEMSELCADAGGLSAGTASGTRLAAAPPKLPLKTPQPSAVCVRASAAVAGTRPWPLQLGWVASSGGDEGAMSAAAARRSLAPFGLVWQQWHRHGRHRM